MKPEEYKAQYKALEAAIWEHVEAGITPELRWDDMTAEQRAVIERTAPAIIDYFAKHEPEDMAQAEQKWRQTN